MRKAVAVSLTVIAIIVDPAVVLAVDLTSEERQYLQDHPTIPYCVDPDWAPYETINEQGAHYGIAADLLQLAASRVGVKLALVRTARWEESLEAARSGRCMFLSFLNHTPKRAEWLTFTEPLFIDTNVIITREEHHFIADLASIANETIVLPTGTSVEEGVRRDFPLLTIISTQSEAEAFAMVSQRKADMTMRSMTVAVYTIKKEGWFNLKISGQVPGYENRLRVGVRKEEPVLRAIMDKGIATITPAERGQIANRHVSINVQTAIDYELIKRLVFIFAVILLTSLFWNAKLKKLNERLRIQSRTDNLTGLSNRADLNVKFQREIDRAARYSRPLSIIMVDMDHFKKINDELGHIMGDRILKAFAEVAKENTRTIDTVGRWGGEEFLILCPETDAEQAAVVAQRLCEAVRNRRFESGRVHTVSIGVAVLGKDDTIDALLHRADEALYRAKNSGRDRVCML